jgi:DNA-binding LacI/PurR family transcriptional regulator
MSTIKDIAKISGFSVNTVSNAMRNKDNVKKALKKKFVLTPFFSPGINLL